MRFRRPVRFRWALLVLLLGLVLFASLSIGGIGRQSANYSAEDLAAKVLSQTSLRIQERVDDFLESGVKIGKLNAALLQSRHFHKENIDDLLAYWLEVMRTQPHWTRLPFGLEE